MAIEPLRQSDQVGNNETQHKSEERRLEIITIRLVPVAGRENDQRQNVDEKKRRNERLRLLADKRRGESQQGKKDDELYNVTHDIGRELPTHLLSIRSFHR